MSEKNENNRLSKIALAMSLIALLSVIGLIFGSYYFYEERYLVLSNQNIALRAQIVSMLKAKPPQNIERELARIRAELSKGSSARQKSLSGVNYLILIANEKLQFSRDIPGAIASLKMAQQRLSLIEDREFFELKAALNQDLAALLEMSAVDQQVLWGEVGALCELIDKLRLKELGVEIEIAPAKSLTLSNWQNALHSAWNEFKGLIKITRIEQNPIPLTGLIQEQAQLKRELQWLLMQAQWAVLQKNQKIYIGSLQNIEKLVKNYFVENAEEANLFSHLHALEQKNVALFTPDLTKTLQALSQISLEVKE